MVRALTRIITFCQSMEEVSRVLSPRLASIKWSSKHTRWLWVRITKSQFMLTRKVNPGKDCPWRISSTCSRVRVPAVSCQQDWASTQTTHKRMQRALLISQWSLSSGQQQSGISTLPMPRKSSKGTTWIPSRISLSTWSVSQCLLQSSTFTATTATTIRRWRNPRKSF